MEPSKIVYLSLRTAVRSGLERMTVGATLPEIVHSLIAVAAELSDKLGGRFAEFLAVALRAHVPNKSEALALIDLVYQDHDKAAEDVGAALLRKDGAP
jgi:hypothetical protein